ncbi:MAG: hypothetical protein COA42_09005 [Alteromonadaceae bacterium]|nr:MAG: hypothetical protein COA42_09005 [Alteromonadaceae bacterium]
MIKRPENIPTDNTTLDQSAQLYSLPGERLTHILLKISFGHGRGTAKRLHQYLHKHPSQTFNRLTYSAVRTWFHDTCPPKDKRGLVIQTLANDYDMNAPTNVEAWWTSGGIYPFPLAQAEPKTNHDCSTTQGPQNAFCQRWQQLLDQAALPKGLARYEACAQLLGGTMEDHRTRCNQGIGKNDMPSLRRDVDILISLIEHQNAVAQQACDSSKKNVAKQALDGAKIFTWLIAQHHHVPFEDANINEAIKTLLCAIAIVEFGKDILKDGPDALAPLVTKLAPTVNLLIDNDANRSYLTHLRHNPTVMEICRKQLKTLIATDNSSSDATHPFLYI